MPPVMVFRGNVIPFLSVPKSIFPPTLKEKRFVSIREIPAFPLPTKITSIRRREEDGAPDGKHLKHALAMVPAPLNPNELGFFVVSNGNLSIVHTEKSPKKRGRPCGSRNKKMLQREASNSLASSSVIGEQEAVSEVEEG